MGLKKLNEIETKETTFLDRAKADLSSTTKDTETRNSVITEKRKNGNTEIRKNSKVKKSNMFTKQTILLDEKRYLKLQLHLKKNKISFQDFTISLIDNYFSESRN